MPEEDGWRVARKVGVCQRVCRSVEREGRRCGDGGTKVRWRMVGWRMVGWRIEDGRIEDMGGGTRRDAEAGWQQ